MAMPDRGLLAPLSPHEEITLRRVALGIANPTDLPTRDVERLTSLLLIEEYRAGLRLSPTAHPNSAAFDSGAPDEGLVKMADCFTRARG
jgi:hypothetical protein